MSKKLTALSIVTLALLLLAIPPLRAQGDDEDLSRTLTAAEVACNENQLRMLLARLDVTSAGGGNPQRPTTLFVTYSNPFGFFEGLVVANQSPLVAEAGANVEPESFLAFHINPSIRTFLTNPGRQPLQQVSLEREDSASSLVGATSDDALVLSLNPTLAGNQNAGAASARINNIAASAGQCDFLATATRPGRGLVLAGLTTPCHTRFTDFDRMVFALLQRTLRVEVLAPDARDAEVAIYRGEEPLTYRIDVYPLARNGQTLGRLALELQLEATAGGDLTGGQLSVLATCTGGQTAGCTDADVPVRVLIVPPVFGGREVRRAGGPFVVLEFDPDDPALPAPVTVDWTPLLAGANWGF